MELSTWPGDTSAAMISSRLIVSLQAQVLSVTVICTKSPVRTPTFVAKVGLMSAALSQVNFVIGSGNSWSQPLLA
jgi:hypothetical protein